MRNRIILAGLAASVFGTNTTLAETQTIPGSYCYAENPERTAKDLRFSGGKIKNIGVFHVEVSCPMVLIGRPKEVEVTVTLKNAGPYNLDMYCTLIELSSGGTASQKKQFGDPRVASKSKVQLGKSMTLKNKDSSVYLNCNLPPDFLISNVAFESSEISKDSDLPGD